MWPFRKRKLSTQDKETLRDILSRCKELCELSEDSIYNNTSTQELVDELADHIDRIGAGQNIPIEDINFMMLPTAPLQDTSIDNGWGDEFLKLSASFDKIYDWVT
jgi:hypothetical protein